MPDESDDDDTVVEDQTVTDTVERRQSERAARVTDMIGDEAAGLLEDRTYPTTSEELATEYAIESIELPNETESLGSVFDRLPDEEYVAAPEAKEAAAEAVFEHSPGLTTEPYWEGEPADEESTTIDPESVGVAPYEDELPETETADENDPESTDTDWDL